MVGGYVIAVVVAFLLVAAPLIEWMVFGRLDPLVFVAVVLGALLFRIVVPDPVRFEPAGPQVVRDEQPELFEILDMVASAIRQPMPREVYLLEEMNAYVAEIGGIFGVGSRRVVGIGVPLMSVLDPEEFGAVVAHEFGHLNREAGRIGAMVYMTRQAVVRQVIDAPRSLLHRPLMAYARLYLRATASTARAQEFGADALAARATSTKAVAGALARLPFGTVAYDVYHRTEYLPLLASGRQPPLLEGFRSSTSQCARPVGTVKFDGMNTTCAPRRRRSWYSSG
jgi:Zn-dependent protease with chaperone function